MNNTKIQHISCVIIAKNAAATLSQTLDALIVMPTTTPEIKVSSVRSWGAKVVLFGDSFDDAYTHARELAKQKNMTFVHPYDDPDVIAGQGTVAIRSRAYSLLAPDLNNRHHQVRLR
jgi:threonine synthase